MVSVEVIRGPEKGRTFELGDGETIIGRQSEAIPLTDGTVSRRHARLSQRDGAWLIEDVGSANGTYVNGIRVTRPMPVHRGDQIRLGGTLLVFGVPPRADSVRLDVDEDGRRLDASIMATVPASDDSVVIPTPEAGVQAIENLRILYDLSTEVSSIFNLDVLLRRTLDRVFELVGADRAYVLLIGDDGELIPKASRTRGEGPRNGELPISRTIINEVVTKQVGVLSSNAMRDKRFSSGKSVHDYGIRSALCAPIKGREKILGVIHVDCTVSEHTYSTEQLRLLTAIGNQTGLAIENVRLYEAAVRSERLAAVGEAVALLSHHIKNILQALGGGTDLVEKALEQNQLDRARDAWPVVRRSLDRMNLVILNMLAYSKPRTPVLENVNVNHELNECIEMLTPEADEREVALMTDLAEVPPIPADPDGLHQVFLNLLTNALDAVERGRGVVTVSSAFDAMYQRLTVKVSDNGVGIPPEEIDRIFEPFHSTKGHKGTGLGLAVARKVVREHGGVIRVRSSPDQVTTFTITLPSDRGAVVSAEETKH